MKVLQHFAASAWSSECAVSSKEAEGCGFFVRSHNFAAPWLHLVLIHIIPLILGKLFHGYQTNVYSYCLCITMSCQMDFMGHIASMSSHWWGKIERQKQIYVHRICSIWLPYCIFTSSTLIPTLLSYYVSYIYIYNKICMIYTLSIYIYTYIIFIQYIYIYTYSVYIYIYLFIYMCTH